MNDEMAVQSPAPATTVPVPENKKKPHRTDRPIKKSAKKRNGFSLIELLIVVAIILVIAAIAIPSLLKARAAGNNASAAGSLRGWNSSVANFISQHSIAPATASLMGGAENGVSTVVCAAGACTGADGEIDTTTAAALDSGLARSGFTFQYKLGTNSNQYDITAVPISLTAPASGSDSYCIDPTGIYHTGSATTPGTTASGAGCNTDGYTFPMGSN